MMLLRIFTVFVFLTGLLVFCWGSQSFAESSQKIIKLEDVLRRSYENNPTLRAARAELKAVQEEMPQALAGWKPTINAVGNITNADIAGSNFGGADGTRSREIELAFNQPLYRGGRTVAAVDEANGIIMAQRALLNAAQQQILLNVATAYMDVVRDTALLDLGASNEAVIQKELEATQDRYEVGELTLTDVSQSRARLARAKADRIAAMGNLQSSKAVYEQVIGRPAGILDRSSPELLIPETLDDAIVLAEKSSPAIIAALYLYESAEVNVDKIFGELLPELALFGSWNRQYDPQPGLTKESTTKTVGVSANIPLYQAGSVRSRVRQAKHTANQFRLETLESRRDIRQKVISNWESLRATRAEITSREAQVEASKVAREGVRAETVLGSRTVLDALDSDQEYLDAQVALVTTQRNEIVAEFSLAATLGVLTPESLALTDFSKEFETHLDVIKWKILGMDVDIDEGNR